MLLEIILGLKHTKLTSGIMKIDTPLNAENINSQLHLLDTDPQHKITADLAQTSILRVFTSTQAVFLLLLH